MRPQQGGQSKAKVRLVGAHRIQVGVPLVRWKRDDSLKKSLFGFHGGAWLGYCGGTCIDISNASRTGVWVGSAWVGIADACPQTSCEMGGLQGSCGLKNCMDDTTKLVVSSPRRNHPEAPAGRSPRRDGSGLPAGWPKEKSRAHMILFPPGFRMDCSHRCRSHRCRRDSIGSSRLQRTARIPP